MATGTITAFENTVHKSNQWLKDVMLELHWNEIDRAYHALRAVLHTLRDRLTIEEAVDLAAQLPMLIRGVYYEGWHPAQTPVKDRTVDQFVRHVTEAFQGDQRVDAEQVTRGVFRVLEKHVSAGEIEDVKRVLPDSLRSLWE